MRWLLPCQPRTDDSLEIANPIIVVEVLSPSTAQIDTTIKLQGYFEVPSVQHYLIVDPDGRTITHHKRAKGDILETRIVAEGALTPHAARYHNRREVCVRVS